MMKQLKITKQITKRESASLEQHLQEIGRISLLSPEEEVELAKRKDEGDEEAFAILVNANLRFVVSVAKQYQNQGLSLSDLVSIGHLGLFKAVVRFKHQKGFRLISYAVWWIRQCIMQALAEESRPMRMPLNRVNALNRINAARAKLEQALKRAPTLDEIAEELDMQVSEVRLTLQAASRHASMDSPFKPGEENTLLEVIEDPFMESPYDQLLRQSLSQEIYELLEGKVDERERKVLESCFGLEPLVFTEAGVPPKRQAFVKNLEEIGGEINRTRERTRQIKESGLNKVRQSEGVRKLREYLSGG